MIVKVIKENESVIYNSTIYKYNESFEADDAIAASLIERGYVEAISAPAVPVEEDTVADEAELIEGTLDENALEGMTYAELKHLAAEMGLDATGKKADLIERISAQEVTVEKEAIVEEESAGDLPNTDMPV